MSKYKFIAPISDDCKENITKKGDDRFVALVKRMFTDIAKSEDTSSLELVSIAHRDWELVLIVDGITTPTDIQSVLCILQYFSYTTKYSEI